MGTLGKHVRDKKKLVGASDRSGFLYNTCDLVKQMEWRGNSLKWTGLMVGRDELDIPNENLRPFKADPKEGVLPPNNRPFQFTGTNPPFYGPTLSTQQILNQLAAYNGGPPP